MENLTDETLTETQPIKQRKEYEFKKKRYHVEIESIGQPNYVVGDYCTLKQLADGINELKFFKFNVTKHMLTELYYKRSASKAISNVIITKI